MALAFLNRCGFRASSSGTGSFVVASALTGMQTPAQAAGPAAVDGATYRYFAQSDDLTQWEYGSGVYTSGDTMLTRATVYDNSSGGTTALSFSAAPQVRMGGPLAQDIVLPTPATVITSFQTLYLPVVGPMGYRDASGDFQILSGPNLGILSSNVIENLPTSSLVSNVVGVHSDFNLDLPDGNIESLDFSSLVAVGGNFILKSHAGLTSLDLLSLTAVGLLLEFDGATLSALPAIDLPALTSVGGSVSITGCPALETIDMSALPGASYISILSNDALTDVELTALVKCGKLTISSCPLVDTIDLSSLFSVGDLEIRETAAVALDFSTLNDVGNITSYDNASLATVDISALLSVTGSQVYFGGCALTESAVDDILVKLASLDGTGGTTSFDNGDVDLSGGTNAPPSATGLTAKATLEGRGNTVTVNV